MPRTKSEWLAVACVILSVAWLYTGINLEPVIALLTSILAFIGLRTPHSMHRASVAPEAGNGQFDPVALLNPAALYERIKILRKSHMHLRSISPSEMPQILALFPLYEQSEALKLLAPNLSAHPSPAETEDILKRLPLYERTAGAAFLAHIVASNKRLEPTSGTLVRPSSAQP